MKKFLTLTAALALFASASAEDLIIFGYSEGYPTLENPPLIGLGISPDARYVCGAFPDGLGIFIGDTQTLDVTFQYCEDEEKGGELRNVNPHGIAVGFEDTGETYNFANGQVGLLPFPKDARSTIAEDITDDGSMIVGSLYKSGATWPAVFENNEWTQLPLPSTEALAEYGLERITGGSAKKVSGDGSVILGFAGSFTIPCLWTRNADGGYDLDFFPARYLKATEDDPNPERVLTSISAMYLALSQNGRYAMLMARIFMDDGETNMNVPVRYDIENRTLFVYDEPQLIDESYQGLYPSAVANDGTFIGCVGMPAIGSLGTFIMEYNKTQAELWRDAFPAFKEKYGQSDEYGFNVPTGISADGRYLLAYTYHSDNFDDEVTPAYYQTYLIDRGPEAGVEGVAADSADSRVEAVYSLDGRRLSAPAAGLNIIRKTDGTTEKLIVR